MGRYGCRSSISPNITRFEEKKGVAIVNSKGKLCSKWVP